MPVLTRSGAVFEFDEFYDLETMWQIYFRRVYDVHTSDRVIVDAGANIGLFACYAAGIAPEAVIYAVEPMPATHERLVRTVRRNSLESRIRCYREALNSEIGDRLMAMTSASQMAHIVDAMSNAGSVSVKTTTLTSFVDRIPERHIDLLKMDIEGSEYEVLSSTPHSVLRRFCRIVVEYHQVRDDVVDKRVLAGHLISAGFDLREDYDAPDAYGMFHFTRR
jgi:FkbM family methyltransferase